MTAAAAFNNGRSQINFNDVQIGYEYPFLNVLKSASGGWFKRDNTAPPDPDTLDGNGYPISLAGGLAITTVCFVPSQTDRPGNYVIGWTGNGTVDVGLIAQTPAAGFSSGDLTSTTGSGRYKFLPSVTSFNFGISGIGSPRITYMYCCHEDDETALLAGEVFGVKFKQRLAEANFGVLRFLNWQHVNVFNITNWASRKPVSYVFWGGAEARASLWAGSTTNSGPAYTASAPPGWVGLVDKATVLLKFDRGAKALILTAVSSGANTVLTIPTASTDAQFNTVGETVTVGTNFNGWASMNGTHTVTARGSGTVTINFDSSGLPVGQVLASGDAPVIAHSTCSLNVGGTGVKNILGRYSNAMSIGNNDFPVGLANSNMAQLIYDATLDSWLKMGGDVADGCLHLDNGVPLEICVQLAAEVGAHPWFVTPIMAADPFTDFMPSLAQYCKDNGPSWMIPRFEGPNEDWNSRFPGTNYSNNKATAYGWPDGSSSHHRHYGKIMSVLGQAMATVYNISNLGRTYHVVCGVQTSAAGNSLNNSRFNSASYIGTTPQSPYSATVGVAEAYRWISAGCLSNYMVPAMWTMPEEASLATRYAAGDVSAAKSYADSLLGSGNTNADLSLSDLATHYAAFKTQLQGFGINRMFGYEGGYSSDFSSAFISSNADLLRAASKFTANTGAYIISTYTAFTRLSDATFTAEFPSSYHLAGGIVAGSAGGHTGGVWSVLDPSIWVAAPSAQWTAICSFNAPKRAINLRIPIHG